MAKLWSSYFILFKDEKMSCKHRFKNFSLPKYKYFLFMIEYFINKNIKLTLRNYWKWFPSATIDVPHRHIPNFVTCSSSVFLILFNYQTDCISREERIPWPIFILYDFCWPLGRVEYDTKIWLPISEAPCIYKRITNIVCID